MEKRALITGAAARLGAAMAEGLAEGGFDVAIHYAGSAAQAEDVAEKCRAYGTRISLHQADFLDEAKVAPLVDEAVATLGGPIGVLINNASIFEYDTIETATRDSWDRHIESNLRAPVVLSQAFARQVPKGAKDENGEPIASGLIVNMIDQRVRALTPEFTSYTIAKYGLWGFTQTAAQALAPDIRVNAIGPGPTLQGGRQTAEAFARQRAATISGRGAHPADIVAALRYFLASPAITGQLLCVDGGQHLSWETPDVVGVE